MDWAAFLAILVAAVADLVPQQAYYVDVPEAPVYPIWLQGAGRVLPKGEALPVPMNCTVLVGDPLHWQGDRQAFLDELRGRLEELKAKAPPQRWA